MDLATPEAFEADPGLVWLFYGYRRHVAMGAEPGEGHRALAGMAEKYPDFLCVSQNVDSMLPIIDLHYYEVRSLRRQTSSSAPATAATSSTRSTAASSA